MTQLATRNGPETQPCDQRPHQTPSPAFTVDEVWRMAAGVAKSGLFPGAKTPEQAFTMMLICQADGLHPINAVRRFHVIEGRPSMRADAIQAEFQARGGRVRWVESTGEVCVGEFTHPKFHPEPFRVRMELSRFVENKVAMSFDDKSRQWGLKKNWKNWPDAMLRARAVSAGVRAVDPGVLVGISSEDEVRDIISLEAPAPYAECHAAVQRSADLAIAAADGPVPGWDPAEPDTRPYHEVIRAAVAAVNASVGRDWGDRGNPPAPLDARKVHGLLAARAVNTDHADGPAPTKVAAAVTFMTKVYAAHRQWVRSELALVCGDHAGEAAEALAARREAEAQDGAEQPAPADLGWVHQAPGGKNDADDGDDLDGIPEPGANG